MNKDMKPQNAGKDSNSSDPDKENRDKEKKKRIELERKIFELVQPWV